MMQDSRIGYFSSPITVWLNNLVAYLLIALFEASWSLSAIEPFMVFEAFDAQEGRVLLNVVICKRGEALGAYSLVSK